MDNDVKLLVYAPDPLKPYTTLSSELDAITESLLFNNASHKPAAVQVCPLASPVPDAVANPNQKKCNITSLTIKSGKQSKVVKPAEHDSTPLEIVGGYKNNKKTVDCSLALAGPCGNHNNKTYDVLLTKQKSNADLSLVTESVPFYKIFDNGVIFPWNAKKNEYTINANTCGAGVSRKLIVYPDIEISLDVPISFADSTEKTQRVTNSQKNAHLYDEKSSSYKVEAKYKEDGREWSISPSIQDKFKKVKDFKKITDNVIGTLQKAFDETIKVTVNYPVGKIHFDYTYKEKNEPFKVGSEWHAQFSMDPLIGASVNIQLDELFLKGATGPIGTIYSKAKKALAKANVEIKFEFIVTGTIKVDSGLSKEIGSSTDSGTKGGAGVTGKIEADLKASAELKLQLIIIAVEGSAEAGAKTGIEVFGGLYQTAADLGVDFNFKFLGVTFYYNWKASGGPQRKTKDKKKTETTENAMGSYGGGDKVTVGEAEFPFHFPISKG